MTYQIERDQFIAQFARTFPDVPITVANAFLRLSTTLHRLAEAQCNGDWPCDNGQRPVEFCPLCEGGYVKSAITGGPLATLAHKAALQAAGAIPDGLAKLVTGDNPKACPDCRTVARAVELARVHIPTHKIITQGDPRGCVLYIYPGNVDRAEFDSGRTRGIAVPGRY